MIYTVECSYADPSSEREWNDFYSLDKLPALISVSGFHTSQRFRAITRGCPVYLAVHTIDGLEVLNSDEYRARGGGNFARCQQHITDWHRNLYGAIGCAPAVAAHEVLVLSARGPEALTAAGVVVLEMEACALERNPARRWLAVLPAHHAALAGGLPPDVHVYAPITAQRVATHAVGEPRAPQDGSEASCRI